VGEGKRGREFLRLLALRYLKRKKKKRKEIRLCTLGGTFHFVVLERRRKEKKKTFPRFTDQIQLLRKREKRDTRGGQPGKVWRNSLCREKTRTMFRRV